MLLVLTVIDLAFLTSKLSATALIGLLDGSKFVIIILVTALKVEGWNYLLVLKEEKKCLGGERKIDLFIY